MLVHLTQACTTRLRFCFKHGSRHRTGWHKSTGHLALHGLLYHQASSSNTVAMMCLLGVQYLFDRAQMIVSLVCRYYGYRLDDAFDEDPRLQALDRTWFANKKVLDIGCNEGLLTLSLACKFGCKAVTGVDIDSVLVAKACKALSALRSQLAAQLRAHEPGCA